MRVRTKKKQGRACTPHGKAALRSRKQGRSSGQFAFMNHGGARDGSGRKPAKGPDGKRVHNPHTVRESFTLSRPVHVTVRVRAGLPSLRGLVLAPVVLAAFEAGNERKGFRLVHFSLQQHHWHLICEAEGPEALGAAIKGLNVRVARAINKQLGLEGPVIEDRYHLEVLRSPTQVRNALRYVLRNGEKHGVHLAVRHGDPRPCPDPLSSAAWYAYWKEGALNVLATQSAATVVKPAQCYLLREGLRRQEPLSLLDAPPANKPTPRSGILGRRSGILGRRSGIRVKGCASETGSVPVLGPVQAPRAPPATLRR